ncbi:MAG: hypothetical protein H6619_03030 [Deltaproteobacteria bacterium]|nr:hypothetical protein [Deltaproteobacteria bacterium]
MKSQPQPVRAELDLAVTQGFGAIEGMLLDHNGTPLVNRVLIFDTDSFGEGSDQKHTRTNGNGEYSIGKLRACSWNAFLVEDNPKVPETVTRYMGKVDVVADQTTTHDLYTYGERTISGNVLLSQEGFGELGDGGVMLFLELYDPIRSEVAGRGMTVNYGRAPWESTQSGETAQEDEESERDSYTMGEFSFTGLESQSYELRVLIDRDTPTLYFAREANLVDGDVRLDLGTINFDQYIKLCEGRINTQVTQKY